MLSTVKKSLPRGGSIFMLPIGRIQPNPDQPRKVFDGDKLRDLSHSIAEHGVIQPITVRQADGRYILVAGERRLRAAIMAGLREIPAIISDIDQRHSSLIALIENLQRSDLDFFEEALGIDNLIRTYGLSQEEAARRLGLTQSAVSNKLRVLKLSRSQLRSIIENGLTERHARALLRLPDEDARQQALKHVIAAGLNVSQTEEYIERRLTPAPVSAQPKRIFLLKDIRPFLNTINHAVDTMRSSGFSADLEKEESDASLRLTINISKKR